MPSGSATAIRRKSCGPSVTLNAPRLPSRQRIRLVPGMGITPSPWAGSQASANGAGVHLALANQLGQRADRLLQRRLGVEAVRVVQVDCLHAQVQGDRSCMRVAIGTHEMHGHARPRPSFAPCRSSSWLRLAGPSYAVSATAMPTSPMRGKRREAPHATLRPIPPFTRRSHEQEEDGRSPLPPEREGTGYFTCAAGSSTKSKFKLWKGFDCSLPSGALPAGCDTKSPISELRTPKTASLSR